ncbi:MAG: hypothetical protein ABI091_06585 [Ferruginibacter sp.]
MMLVTASLLISCSVNCFAQKENKKWTIGIFSESGLTLGDANKIYKYTSGGSLRLSVHAGPGFITLSGGGTAFIPNLSSLADTLLNNINGNDTSLNINVSKYKVALQIPVKMGYKYIISHHFFVMAEAGFSQFYTYYEDDNSKIQHTKSSGFTYALSTGYQGGSFEIGLKYEACTLKNSTISDIGLRLGFNF